MISLRHGEASRGVVYISLVVPKTLWLPCARVTTLDLSMPEKIILKI